MGLNLAANSPRWPRAEAPRLRRAPSASGRSRRWRSATSPTSTASSPSTTRPSACRSTPGPGTSAIRQFRRQFQADRRALAGASDAGRAGAGRRPDAGAGSWVDRRCRTSCGATRGCDHDRAPLSAAQLLRAAELAPVPDVDHLLSSYATVGLAARPAALAGDRPRAAPSAARRRAQLGRLPRQAGVSDTFASSLWATDALFSLLRAGVDGVNVHTLPDAAYELFAFSRHDGRWQRSVRPVYYGLELFAQAAPAGLPAARRAAARSRHGTERLGHPRRATAPSASSHQQEPVARETVTRARCRRARRGARPSSGCRPRACRSSTRRDARRADLRRRDHRHGTAGARERQRALPSPEGGYTITVPRASAALVTVAA